MGTLARPPERTVRTQGARAHPKTRSEWRRDVVQGEAAITAGWVAPVVGAQPVPARGTLRIQTLHRPARQILHKPPKKSLRNARRLAGEKKWRAPAEIRGDCEGGGLVCQEESILLVVVGWPGSIAQGFRFGLCRETQGPLGFRVSFLLRGR